MHLCKNSNKYALVTIGLLFVLTVSVFIIAGLPEQTPATNSEISDQASASTLSDSPDVPFDYSLPYQYLAAIDQQLKYQAKAEEIKALYSSQSTQNDEALTAAAAEAGSDEELMLTASVARGIAGGDSRDAGKTVAATEQVTTYKYVNANQLNVRSGVGTDYDKLATLKRGDKVGLIKMEGEWAKIRTLSGLTGYVVARYLVNSEAEVEPEKPIAYWYINANQLNVRSGPGTEYEKIETLSRGAKIGYFATEGEWARIQTPSGKTGYMLLKYLVESESEVERSASIPSAGSSAVTPLAQQIVDYSLSLQGVRYVYGGYSTKGFDCSGFVKYVYAHFGINVPRSSADYAGFGKKVSRENLRPSDILLFDTDGGNWDVSHVGIYIGNGKFIHASTTKGKVVIASLSEYPAPYYGARRVID